MHICVRVVEMEQQIVIMAAGAFLSISYLLLIVKAYRLFYDTAGTEE